jgi:hypothetical protein
MTLLVPIKISSLNQVFISVRDHFAQDMYVYNQQTVGFRDGAVNNTNINIDGEGYNRSGLGNHRRFTQYFWKQYPKW